jgi:bla regulator protein BlaR1
MNDFWQMIATSNQTRFLGWTLIHSIWLGTLVALHLAAMRRLLGRCSSNTRYVMSCAALVVFVALTTSAYFATSAAEPSSHAIDHAKPTGSNLGASIAGSAQFAVSAPPLAPNPLWTVALRAIDSSLPSIALLWLVGVTAIALWQISAWIGARRVGRSARPLRDSALSQTVVSIARNMKIRRHVKIFESALVKVPTLIGWLSPAILLPVGLIGGLSPSHLRAILAHEFAHVRRHDYLINLLQTVAETLFFFHPAVWYISVQIRSEREACCDDIVIAGGTEALTYAQSLLCIAQRALAMENISTLSTSIAMGAVGKPSELRRRVGRLLGSEERPPRFARGWAIPLLVIAGLAAGLLHARAAVSTAAQPARPSRTVAKADPPAKSPVAASTLQFRLVADADDKSEADEMPNPNGGKPLRVLKPVVLDGKDVTRAYEAKSQNNSLAIGIDFSAQGAEKLKKLTADNINHRLAMIVDGKLLSAPTIKTTLAKSVQISGSPADFTPEKVKALIDAINASIKPDI